jgi:fatty-acyl-CoA synthase
VPDRDDEKVIARMHMRQVTIAYGMTETSPISFQSGLDDPLERRVSTVGRVQPHLEVKIVDGDGRIVPVGTAGELCTRGYSVMRGYWKDDERTRESIDAAGWMHSGDLATIDAEGYANIVGRVKDMLIRGGENVYPREIEEYLLRHPASRTRRCSAFPTRSTARRSAPGSCRGAATRSTRTRCATSASGRSPTTRCRAMSASSCSSR